MAAKKTAKGAPSKSRAREVWGIIIVALAAALVLALVTHDPRDWPGSSRGPFEPTGNLLGPYGALVSHVLLLGTGYSAYVLALLTVVTGIVVFLHRPFRMLVRPGLLLIVAGVFLPVLAGLVGDIGLDTIIGVRTYEYGGMTGGFLGYLMSSVLGRTGAIILSLAIVLVTIVLTTDLKPSTLVEWFIDAVKPVIVSVRDAVKERASRPAPRKSPRDRRPAKPVTTTGGSSVPDDALTGESDESPFVTPLADDITDEEYDEPSGEAFEPTIVGHRPPDEMTGADGDDGDAAYDGDTGPEGGTGRDSGGDDEFDMEADEYDDDYEYELPGPDLLDEPLDTAPPETRDEMLDKAQKLEESLRHFNVRAEVRQITPGPIVTRYELTLAPGVKVGKVVGLSDDLAMTLRAKGGIRILAPIPGKAAIGIEVPNKGRSVVYFREIVESDAFAGTDSPLVIALGKSTSGEPVVTDLEKMPHLLIAGSTGSGKSVCINCLIASILMKATPSQVRMIMVDPKVVELSTYNAIPHLLTPVITDPKRAAASLRWAVREMEGRYRRLAALGVRDISQYNAKVAAMLEKAGEGADDDIPEPLPLMVIIIDEFADLMVVASNEIEESIARLAQMARAVGMHLVIATQRPSADVITGLIKANFPSRIAFKVMQSSNSRIILDQGGADKLLGLGDMLFLQAGKPEPFRLHGAYISNDECQRLVDFVAGQSAEGPVEVNEEMFASEDEGDSDDNALGMRDPNERDALFYDAARLVVRHQQGSVSLLQRRLKVGYARAARLVDQLELAGIVSEYDGSKARDVLVDESYIDELEAGDI